MADRGLTHLHSVTKNDNDDILTPLSTLKRWENRLARAQTKLDYNEVSKVSRILTELKAEIAAVRRGPE